MFSQDLGAKWLLSHGCLAKWKHWFLVSLEVGHIWDEVAWLVLWNLDSWTFPKVLHRGCLHPTLDRDWRNAHFQFGLRDIQKKVMRCCILSPAPVGSVLSYRDRHEAARCLALLTNRLYFLLVFYSHSERSWDVKSVLTKKIRISDNWGF